jgi:hypothetical protein
MRFIKMLGLAAVAAIAAMVLFGASSASAVSLCKKSATVLPETCEEAYPFGTTVATQLLAGSIAKLKAEPIGTVECKKSNVTGKTTELKEESLLGTIETVSFAECFLGPTKCTVTVEGLPYTAHLKLFPAKEGYHLTVLNGKAKVVCGLVLSCTFGAPEILFKLLHPTPWRLQVAQELNREGGSPCPSTSFWEATYEVTAPTPLTGVGML